MPLLGLPPGVAHLIWPYLPGRTQLPQDKHSKGLVLQLLTVLGAWPLQILMVLTFPMHFVIGKDTQVQTTHVLCKL